MCTWMYKVQVHVHTYICMYSTHIHTCEVMYNLHCNNVWLIVMYVGTHHVYSVQVCELHVCEASCRLVTMPGLSESYTYVPVCVCDKRNFLWLQNMYTCMYHVQVPGTLLHVWPVQYRYSGRIRIFNPDFQPPVHRYPVVGYLFLRCFSYFFGGRFGRVSRGTLQILATIHAVLIELQRVLPRGTCTSRVSAFPVIVVEVFSSEKFSIVFNCETRQSITFYPGYQRRFRRRAGHSDTTIYLSTSVLFFKHVWPTISRIPSLPLFLDQEYQ